MARTGDESEAFESPERTRAYVETSGSERSNAGEDAEIELLGDGELLDEVEPDEETWSPGEPPPGVPADEVLDVHPLTEAEPSADLLDVSEDDLERPVPEDDVSAETPAGMGGALQERTVLGGHDLETRYEELDSEDTAVNALEGTGVGSAETEFVCRSCFLQTRRAARRSAASYLSGLCRVGGRLIPVPDR